MKSRTCDRRIAAAVIAGLVTGWAGAGAAPAAAAETFERGKIIEKVVCREAPDQSYALYLPSGGPPAAKRPVLYLLDPGARGSVAIERFRPAAEQFGWMLVASNNSRNGPWEPSLKAVRAMWLDSTARLPIDDTRIYAGGFSGGARVASIFPGAIGRTIAGIIGVGAGVAEGVVRPDEIGASAYFGIVGLADFNYAEMKLLDAAFDATRLPHRILFYEAPHQWPDQETCRRAISWMDITAMRQGSRPRDAALIDAAWTGEIQIASALLAAGRTFWAAGQYEAVVRLFDGLRDVTGAAAEAERLRRSREYASFLKAEDKRTEFAASLQRDLQRAYALVERSAGNREELVAVLQDLGLGTLRKEAGAARAVEDRSAVYRTLVGFSIQLQQKGDESYSRKDWPRAAAFYELSAESSPDGDPRAKGLYYNLACVTAIRGDGAMALKHLRTAVDRGFSDVRTLENDKDLEKIRTTPAFRALVERVKQAR